MKRFLVMLSAFSLVSCQTPLIIGGAGENAAVAVGDKVLLEGTHKLQLAADAYTAAAEVAAVAVRQGAFSDTQLRMLQTLNNQALRLLEGGGTVLTVAQRSAGLLTIADQLRDIVGSK